MVCENTSGPGGVESIQISLKFVEDFMTVLAVCVEYQTVDTVQMLVLERPLLLSEGGSGSWISSLPFPLCLLLG